MPAPIRWPLRTLIAATLLAGSPGFAGAQAKGHPHPQPQPQPHHPFHPLYQAPHPGGAGNPFPFNRPNPVMVMPSISGTPNYSMYSPGFGNTFPVPTVYNPWRGPASNPLIGTFNNPLTNPLIGAFNNPLNNPLIGAFNNPFNAPLNNPFVFNNLFNRPFNMPAVANPFPNNPPVAANNAGNPANNPFNNANPLLANPLAVNPLLQEPAFNNPLGVPGFQQVVAFTPPADVVQLGAFVTRGPDLQVNPISGTVVRPISGTARLADGTTFYRVPGAIGTGTGLYFNPQVGTVFDPSAGTIRRPGPTPVFLPYIWG